jgi:integrase
VESSCGFPKPQDRVFASYQTFGKMPMWPDSLRRKMLQPVVRKLSIQKQIGWHTFRRTDSSLLFETRYNRRILEPI